MVAAKARQPAPETPTADEMRAVLEAALRDLDSDERSGPLLRASALSIGLELTDVDMRLVVASADDDRHHLSWEFDRAGQAKLVLRMDAATANAFLQGKESLAIAIARGRVRLKGDSKTAFLYLPALRLLCDPYRRTVEERYPQFAVG